MKTRNHQVLIKEALTHLKGIRLLQQEHVMCLPIGSNGRVIACHTIFIGTLTSSAIHPREIFAAAIADHAMEIIIAHNHPSGMTMPSDRDIETTQQLAAAGQILGIPLRDHIIVARREHFSFLSHGLLLPDELRLV
jgi:DNA repair protein RadC